MGLLRRGGRVSLAELPVAQAACHHEILSLVQSKADDNI
jgi:hypothetical protein